MANQKPIILAVDDEKDMLETYRAILAKKYAPLTAASGTEALKIIKDYAVALVLLDVRMPKTNGIEVLKNIKANDPDLDVIMVTASKDIDSAVEAMKLGALDYITKPFDVKELLAIIGKALEKRALVKENLYLKEALKETTAYCDLIGRTPVMKKLFESIGQVAPTDSTVLIHGESGTGKELVARAIHKKSRRANKPFVAINCAAIPENLLESELFGHERGSFTGALERKLGKFELADGGTLFLDEIGCMPAPMQAKLLRVLEDQVIERLGGEKGIPVNVRLISATNIDFQKHIEEGKFRHDLYYRLNVIPIALAPLRERKEDLPLFVEYFMMKFNKTLNKNVQQISAEALQALQAYGWPGNVRELQNLIERVLVLSRKNKIEKEDIPFDIQNKAKTITVTLKDKAEDFERKTIQKTLAENNGNVSQAAKILKMARTSLNSRMRTLGINSQPAV